MNTEKIKYLRETNNYTQEAISKIMGVARGTYAGWEVKNDNIPLKKFYKLCKILNTSMDYIADIKKEYAKNTLPDNINLSKLSENLKLIRLKNKDTEKTIANIIGVDRTTYLRYEKNVYPIQTEALIRFAKHYKISLDSLFK